MGRQEKCGLLLPPRTPLADAEPPMLIEGRGQVPKTGREIGSSSGSRAVLLWDSPRNQHACKARIPLPRNEKGPEKSGP